jgi:hypothetical protein
MIWTGCAAPATVNDPICFAIWSKTYLSASPNGASGPVCGLTYPILIARADAVPAVPPGAHALITSAAPAVADTCKNSRRVTTNPLFISLLL